MRSLARIVPIAILTLPHWMREKKHCARLEEAEANKQKN
jgi:hypothetical protein